MISVTMTMAWLLGFSYTAISRVYTGKASSEQMFCRQITQVPVQGIVILSLVTATCFSQFC